MESGHAGNQFQAGRRRHCHLLPLTIHRLVGREVIDIEAEESFAAWCGGELLQSGLQSRVHSDIVSLPLCIRLGLIAFLAAAGSKKKKAESKEEESSAYSPLSLYACDISVHLFYFLLFVALRAAP